MFTGIVEELGEVAAVERYNGGARLTVNGPTVVPGAACGDSIAVNGVCLTVTATSGAAFTADVMGETLRRSGIGSLSRGSPVNLERPLRAGDRLGGHLVQGHVDGTGRILSRAAADRHDDSGQIAPDPADSPGQTTAAGASSEVVRISLPPTLARYVAEKGSVAVDGVSLTVSAIGGAEAAMPAGPAPPPVPDQPAADGYGGPWFEVSLIPTTLHLTTLGRKQPGDAVNLEVDVVAKYVEKLLEWRQR